MVLERAAFVIRILRLGAFVGYDRFRPGRCAASKRNVKDGIASVTIGPRYPSLYQLNTRVWLRRLSRDRGKRTTLADIDDVTIDGFARQGFDWIWLLSVWRTGPAGRAVSRMKPEWRAEFSVVLPDLDEDDICGSGFAVTAYTVSDEIGGDAALAQFRERLAQRDADAGFRAEPYRARSSLGEVQPGLVGIE